MLGSLVVGMVSVLLGAVCIAAGVAISVAEVFRPVAVEGAFAVKDLTKLGKVVAEILRAFGKLKPAAQLLFVGLVLFGVGSWLLASRPF